MSRSGIKRQVCCVDRLLSCWQLHCWTPEEACQKLASVRPHVLVRSAQLEMLRKYYQQMCAQSSWESGAVCRTSSCSHWRWETATRSLDQSNSNRKCNCCLFSKSSLACVQLQNRTCCLSVFLLFNIVLVKEIFLFLIWFPATLFCFN